jgi:hypothetical protein
MAGGRRHSPLGRIEWHRIRRAAMSSPAVALVVAFHQRRAEGAAQFRRQAWIIKYSYGICRLPDMYKEKFAYTPVLHRFWR